MAWEPGSELAPDGHAEIAAQSGNGRRASAGRTCAVTQTGVVAKFAL